MSSADVLNFILIGGAVIFGITFGWSQFQSAKRKGTVDALDVALKEIEALRGSNERLTAEVAALRTEFDLLRQENATLRELIHTNGVGTVDDFRRVMHEETERVGRAIAEDNTARLEHIIQMLTTLKGGG